MQYIKHKVSYLLILLAVAFSALFFSLAAPAATYAAPTACGDHSNGGPVEISIDIGCKGKGNPILDMTFAIVRFLSIGVGLVIVGSLTYAGIQYIGSRGDPNANAQAVQRIQANVFALFLFIFAYAIINYIVPGGLLS